MSAELASLIQNPNIKFRLFIDGEPVSRSKAEDKSTLPKPIVKGGAADKLWTIEPVKATPGGSLPGPPVYLLRCDGVLVGQRDFLVYAFLDEKDQTDIAKWTVAAGQDNDGETKLCISLDSSYSWRDPGGIPDGDLCQKQIPIFESFLPEFRFTIQLVPE